MPLSGVSRLYEGFTKDKRLSLFAAELFTETFEFTNFLELMWTEVGESENWGFEVYLQLEAGCRADADSPDFPLPCKQENLLYLPT